MLVYVINNEILSPVLESQVFRPLSVKAKAEGVDAKVVAIIPVGLLARKKLRRSLFEVRGKAKDKYSIDLSYVISGTSRWSSATLTRWLVARVFKRILKGRDWTVYERNCNTASLVIDVLKGNTEGKVVFDCRGDIPSEFIGGKGLMWDPEAWDQDTLRQYENLMQLERNSCLADSIIVVSKALGELLQERHRGECAKITVLPCKIDPKVFSSPDKDISKKRLGLDGRFVVCYLGSLAWYQLPDQSVRVFKCIQKIIPNSIFLGITTAPETMRGYLIESGICESDFHVMRVSSPEVVEYLPAADLGLLLREDNPVNAVASPVKFAEYLACKVPVLLTRKIGDFSLLAQCNRVGDVLDIHCSDDELMGQLSRILEGRSSDSEIFDRCRNFALSELSWDHV